MSEVSRWKFLDRKAGSVYKQLFVKGRNVAARTLYGRSVSEEEPRTAEQIAADFDLPVEAVLEAIAYCESDPQEIREDWEREEANVQKRLRTRGQCVRSETASAGQPEAEAR
ncbi:MAG TPA: hypothetical protein VML55_25215 [Planctomycetaceae bacterium]|nr:hypothetical protein [Planctomycetaceae bacterium]